MKNKIVYFSIIIVLLLGGLLIVKINMVKNVRNLCNYIKDNNTKEALKLASKIKNFNKTSSAFPKLVEMLEGEVTTPLIEASRKGNKKMIKYLLEHGADMNYAPNGMEYPLEAFTNTGLSGGVDTLKLMLKYTDKPDAYKYISPLFRVALTLEHVSSDNYEKNVEMILLFIDAGANWQNSIDGDTILHYAARQDNSILLKELLNRDESKKWLNVKNDNGETPLSVAIDKNYVENANLLKNAS